MRDFLIKLVYIYCVFFWERIGVNKSVVISEEIFFFFEPNSFKYIYTSIIKKISLLLILYQNFAHGTFIITHR